MSLWLTSTNVSASDYLDKTQLIVRCFPRNSSACCLGDPATCCNSGQYFHYAPGRIVALLGDQGQDTLGNATAGTSSSSSSGGSNDAAIGVGSVIAGLVAGVLGTLAFFYLRKKKRTDKTKTNAENNNDRTPMSPFSPTERQVPFMISSADLQMDSPKGRQELDVPLAELPATRSPSRNRGRSTGEVVLARILPKNLHAYMYTPTPVGDSPTLSEVGSIMGGSTAPVSARSYTTPPHGNNSRERLTNFVSPLSDDFRQEDRHNWI